MTAAAAQCKQSGAGCVAGDRCAQRVAAETARFSVSRLRRGVGPRHLRLKRCQVFLSRQGWHTCFSRRPQSRRFRTGDTRWTWPRCGTPRFSSAAPPCPCPEGSMDPTCRPQAAWPTAESRPSFRQGTASCRAAGGRAANRRDRSGLCRWRARETERLVRSIEARHQQCNKACDFHRKRRTGKKEKDAPRTATSFSRRWCLRLPSARRSMAQSRPRPHQSWSRLSRTRQREGEAVLRAAVGGHQSSFSRGSCELSTAARSGQREGDVAKRNRAIRTEHYNSMAGLRHHRNRSVIVNTSSPLFFVSFAIRKLSPKGCHTSSKGQTGSGVL